MKLTHVLVSKDLQKAAYSEFENLTWANLFLNANYKYYIENVITMVLH